MKFTEKELLALKAVFYGCNTNRKLAKGDRPSYCIFDKDMKVIEEISFVEALDIVYKIINKESEHEINND